MDGFIKRIDNRAGDFSFKDRNCTPTRGITPDHVAVKLVDGGFDLCLEFSREEVATMVNCYPDYMPTLDAVQRFMCSNPATAAIMLENAEFVVNTEEERHE